MRKIIIKKINELNARYKKLDFDPTLMTSPSYFDDKFLLEVFESLVRYDEEQNIKKYILNKKG